MFGGESISFYLGRCFNLVCSDLLFIFRSFFQLGYIAMRLYARPLVWTTSTLLWCDHPASSHLSDSWRRVIILGPSKHICAQVHHFSWHPSIDLKTKPRCRSSGRSMFVFTVVKVCYVELSVVNPLLSMCVLVMDQICNFFQLINTKCACFKKKKVISVECSLSPFFVLPVVIGEIAILEFQQKSLRSSFPAFPRTRSNSIRLPIPVFIFKIYHQQMTISKSIRS